MPTAGGRVQAKVEVTTANYALLASLAERHDQCVSAAGRHAARVDVGAPFEGVAAARGATDAEDAHIRHALTH